MEKRRDVVERLRGNRNLGAERRKNEGIRRREGTRWRRRQSRVKGEKRKNEGGVGTTAGGYREEGGGGGAGQIKERKVRERTFGTSSRTKSNFGPAAKLSYFPRNMHACARARAGVRKCSSGVSRPLTASLSLLPLPPLRSPLRASSLLTFERVARPVRACTRNG